MTSTGKKARKHSGMNRFEIKRARRSKADERLADHDARIGTNARHAKRREAEKKKA